MDHRVKEIGEWQDFSPGCRVKQAQYDVSQVALRNPLSVIGRLLGGCAICGRLHAKCWDQVSHSPLKRVCHKCSKKYLDWPEFDWSR